MAKFEFDPSKLTRDQIAEQFEAMKARETEALAGLDGLTGAERLERLEQVLEFRAAQEALVAEVANRDAADAAAAREAEILSKLEEGLDFPAATPVTSNATSSTDAQADATVVETEPASEPDLVDAAAAVASVTNQALVAPPTQTPEVKVVSEPERPAFVAAAGVGISSVAVGQPMTTTDLMDSFNHWLRQAQSHQTFPETIVAAASLYAGVKADDLLSPQNGADRNTELIIEAQDACLARLEGKPAATASVWCEPFPIIEDMPEGSTKITPFSDSLPWRGAARGGFQFWNPWTLAAVEAVHDANSDAFFKVYDSDAQEDIDENNLKPCAEITCPSITSMDLDEITACVKMRIQTEMSNPRSVEVFMGKMAALRARLREQHYMAKFDALAAGFGTEDSPVEGEYGLIPSLRDIVLRYYLSQTYDERLADKPGVLYVPRGFLAYADHDARNVAYKDEALADLQSWLRERVNLRVVEVFDNTAAQAGAIRPNGKPYAGAVPAAGSSSNTLPPLQCVWRIRIAFPQSLIAAATGQYVSGWQSSPELLRENKVQYFAREFGNIARTGEDPQGYIDVKVSPNGGRAGVYTPAECSFTS